MQSLCYGTGIDFAFFLTEAIISLGFLKNQITPAFVLITHITRIE